MSGTLALASAIAEMDRGALESLVRRRRPLAPSSVLDPIGLAAELLRSESILRALTPLDRGVLAVLLRIAVAPPTDSDAADGDEALGALRALGLVGVEDSRPVSLPEVTETLQQALQAAGLAPDDIAAGRALDPGEDTADPGKPDADSWMTAALTSVGQAAECLRVLREHPGRLNRNGTVAVATVRGIAEFVGIDAEHAAQALSAVERAGMVVAGGSSLVVSDRAAEWLQGDHIARWLELAATTLATMPAPLQAALPQRFPLLPAAELETSRRFAAAAEHLGLAAQGRLSRVAELLGSGERAAAAELARQLLPPPAPGVYVQPDLSVVVPGPLAPRDEIELASLTVPEHIGVASTRRITEASIAEAFKRGTTPLEARAVFERVSLTGIPQPLDYLLGSLAERVGNILVGEYHGDDGRTRIIVSRSELADTLMVDRALQHLQLQRLDSTTLLSRLRADHVLAALADARYHASGPREEHPEPSTRATAPTDPQPPANALPEPIAELIERVYLAARSEPGTGDFTRRLELAIRDRTPVRVTAEARGQNHTFLLLPVSLNAGRLRATDQSAGVERTLPVNLITAVEAV
jgi:hypothetical protein